MKLTKKIIVITVLLGIFFASCKNNDPVVEDPQFTYLQSDDKVMSIQQSIAQFMFSGLAAQYDDASGMSSQVTSSVSVYKITYNTTFQGDNLLVSGLVCVPDNAGSYPVLCFQNGTNVEYSKAPTRNPTSDLFQVLESVASMGFIVVIPDYPGFGESEQVLHPYLEEDNTIPSLVDILKATREFASQSDISAALNNDLYIMGYSQGGWATMQLQSEIEHNGLEQYNLKASSCGAGPYNLANLNSLLVSQDSYPMPYFLAFLMDAYQVHGKFTNPLSDIFADPYAAKIPGLFNGINTGEEINAQLTSQMVDLVQPDFRTGFQTNSKYQSIQAAFNANSVVAWNVSTPTRLYHGNSDTFVPIEMSQQLKQDFEGLGVGEDKVQFITLQGADHQGGIFPFGMASLKWFLDLKNN